MKTKPLVLIVEDEPLIADDIAFVLEDEGYQIAGKAIDSKEAFHLIETTNPDIILLDISLEDDEDGIDIAHIINEKYQIPFVFITSHTDKLTLNRVKKTNPCGFIVKPFKPIDIISTLAIVSYKNSFSKKEISSTEDKKEDSFFIKQGYDLVKVQFKDILFVKAEDNFTNIVLSDKKILASLNLKNIAEKLPQKTFVRIHRSYIINIHKINRISERFIYVDTFEIPLGKTYVKEFKKQINTLY